MLVYRHAGRTIEPARVFASIAEAIAGPPTALPDEHDKWTSVLIELGALEAALVDHWSPDRDGWDSRHATIRRLVERVGEAAVDAWAKQPVDPAPLVEALSAAASFDLPDFVTAEIPDGFAYSAIYPEVYVDAA